MLRFNLEPTAYADPSWLPAWAATASPRVRRTLSQALLHEHGVDALFDWTLDAPAARLFLVDAAARRPVELALGIAAHRDSLRRVVQRERLAALRTCLGDPFSVLWLAAADAVPHATTPLAASWAPSDGPALACALADHGRVQLARALDAALPARRAVKVRVAFCLPRRRPGSRADAPAQAVPSPAEARRLTDATVNDLLSRWAPTWTWLF